MTHHYLNFALTGTSLSGNTCTQDNFNHSIILVNQISALQQLIQQINEIDEIAIEELKTNTEFAKFINETIEFIKDSNLMSVINIHHLDNFDKKSFRVLYYLNKQTKDSSISSPNSRKLDRPIYDRIRKNLFRKSNELKRMMVLDERTL